MSELEIIIPKGFMNIAITLSNHLVGDTNNSTNWDDFKIPLPKGKWKIKGYPKGKKVILIK